MYDDKPEIRNAKPESMANAEARALGTVAAARSRAFRFRHSDLIRVSDFGFRNSASRRGFSFAEVMFAVVILGIGFIMVAAIFPVAIQQTAMTGEESMAAAAAREATHSLLQAPASLPFLMLNIAPNAPTNTNRDGFQYNPVPFTTGGVALTAPNYYATLLFPPTVKQIHFPTLLGGPVTVHGLPAPPQQLPGAVVAPLVGARWNVLRGNLMLPSDERFAWIPLYKRESGSNLAQIYIFAVQVRNRSIYERAKDLEPPLAQWQRFNSNSAYNPTAPPQPGNLIGQFVHNNTNFPLINAAYPPTQGAPPIQSPYYPDTVTLTGPFPTLPLNTPAEGFEGWCIRVQATTKGNGAGDGRIYRLGQQITGQPGSPNIASKTFVLAAPDDLRVAPGDDGVWGTCDDIYDGLQKINPELNQNKTNIDMIPPSTFQPRSCRVRLQFKPADGGSVAGRITFYNPTGIGQPLAPPPIPDTAGPLNATAVATNQWQQPEAAAGAYVIVYDDMASDQYSPGVIATPYVHYAGAANGRVYKLGAPHDIAKGEWDLDPDAGMKSSAEDLPRQLIYPPAVEAPGNNHDPLPRAYIVGGAGLIDPQDMYNNSGTTRDQTSGAAQAVSYFTTIIAVQ
jgi:hypothetical protein